MPLLYDEFRHFSNASLEFTNVQCKPVDKSYLTVEYCFIKSVNRTYKYLSVRVRILSKVPITNTTVNFSLLKKANGYKPFLYNITFDACKYLRSRKNKLLNYFHGLFEVYSNLNHTCPFGMDDFVVEKLPISHVQHYVSDILPMPHGKYLLHTTWSSFGVKRIEASFYWDSI
ncbi:uncharacterized protein LOC128868418 [Anastrepha ludens]|uniref:uncharacterized protein LOC128868418 n=1 Tax=Anastrepha ludens TaxID=28586 RepID=UPI0023AF6825|nr:uncharacterized protein LOC128868418 [Anastrepha ludens]